MKGAAVYKENKTKNTLSETPISVPLPNRNSVKKLPSRTKFH